MMHIMTKQISSTVDIHSIKLTTMHFYFGFQFKI